MDHNNYPRLAAMTVLSFVAMYILMYSMVNVFGNVYPSINQFYMAGLMTAPMVILEMLLMGMMYKNKRINLAIIAVAIVALIGFFLTIRYQAAVSDEEFLKSMIPHHAGAILMCEKAEIADPEIQQLCQNILSGQQEEIEQMKRILERL